MSYSIKFKVFSDNVTEHVEIMVCTPSDVADFIRIFESKVYIYAIEGES